MGKTHKIGGAVIGLIILDAILILKIADINPFFHCIPFIVANIIGALLCDIDSINSTISRYLWIIAIPIWLLQKIMGLIFRNPKSKIAKNLKSTVNHRGFAHWPIVYIFGILLITVFSMVFDVLFMPNTETLGNGLLIKIYPYLKGAIIAFLYGLCTGALSHILLDAFNDRGVPLFAPFSFKRKRFMHIATRSKAEKKFKFFLKILCVLFAGILFGLYFNLLGRGL